MTDTSKAEIGPRYRQCAAVLRRRIADGYYPVGEYLPSERRLCKEFKLSRLTIRKTISELVGEGLIRNVPGAGNVVLRRRALIKGSRVVGCIMLRKVGFPVLDPYYGDIFAGLEQRMGVGGYRLLFSSMSSEEMWSAKGAGIVVETVRRHRLEGVVLIGGGSDEFILAIHKKKIPLVLVDRSSPHAGIPSVMPDNVRGAFELTEYILGLGHTRIAFLRAPWDEVVKARYEGFLEAHRRAGLEFDERRIIEGDYVMEAACDGVSRALETFGLGYFTAVFAINDQAAMGAIRALKAKGLQIPGDVSVAGFDDISWAEYADPPLTTVRVPRQEMGRLAAEMVIQILNAPGTAAVRRLLIQPELVVRSSCGPCPSGSGSR